MNITNTITVMAAGVALLGASSNLMAQTRVPIIGYWVDSSNNIGKNS